MTRTLDTETAASRLRTVVMRLNRQLRRAGDDSDLTPTQSAVLGTLMREGNIRMSELAAIESLNPTMLSRVVSKLEDRELAVRVTDPNDRRAAHVQATANGRKLVQRLRARKTALLTERLEQLSVEERALFDAALPIFESLTEEQDPQ